MCPLPLPATLFSMVPVNCEERREYRCAGRKPAPTQTNVQFGAEGIVNSRSIAHGGGVRFSKDSPEYATILDWIKGSKD